MLIIHATGVGQAALCRSEKKQATHVSMHGAQGGLLRDRGSSCQAVPPQTQREDEAAWLPIVAQLTIELLRDTA